MSTLSISKFRAGLFAAVLAVSPLLQAQDVGMAAQMNVPFGFETGTGHHFSPGVYKVRMEDAHTLLIKGASDSAFALTSVEDTAEPATTGEATFRRYGNRYFLKELSVAGKSRRVHFPKSRAEVQAQAQLVVASQSTPANVEVATR